MAFRSALMVEEDCVEEAFTRLTTNSGGDRAISSLAVRATEKTYDNVTSHRAPRFSQLSQVQCWSAAFIFICFCRIECSPSGV